MTSKNFPWVHLKASDTRPPDPPTNYAHPSCYAKELSNCSTDISREHYISRGLLIEMGGKPQIAGFSFQPQDTLRRVGVEALTSHILCKRHNSCLSPLDKEAQRCLGALRTFDAALQDGQTPISDEVTINGADLERWMLKVLIGMNHAKVLGSISVRRNASMIRILFGRERWPSGWGLYVLARPRVFHHAFAGIEIETRAMGSEIWAADFDIAGFPFMLSLGTPRGGGRAHLYRPAGLILSRTSNEATKKLTFGWPRRPHADYVGFTRSGQYDGDRPQDEHLVHE
jgi:hypothetical protein